MKITHNKVGQNLNLNDTKATGRSSGAKGISDIKTGDTSGASKLSDLGASDASKVEISSRAQDIKRAREIAMATPDVDEAKVARLQKLIDSNEYKTDASAIADRMVDEQMKWE